MEKILNEEGPQDKYVFDSDEFEKELERLEDD